MSPTCFWLFNPQTSTYPVSSTAKPWFAPAPMYRILLMIPSCVWLTTSTGNKELAKVSFPNSPLVPIPQATTVPSFLKA